MKTINKKAEVFFLIVILSISIFSCTPREDKVEKPNIMLIVVDDMGYSDLGCYGGEIKTPNLDRLAESGVRMTNFYTLSMCAPTRACLLTGVDNHQNGMGNMPPLHSSNQYMQAGYEGYLNKNVITLPEILSDNGYHTYMAGKWHLGVHSTDNYPIGRGFEKSFAQMGGGSGYFQDGFDLGPFETPITFYTRNDKRIDELPEDFYSTKAFTDEMIQYITEQQDNKPFFGYLAFTAPHDPLHVPDNYMDKYKGNYDKGYDTIRTARLNRMKEMGLIDKSVPYNSGTGNFPTWESLSEDEKKLQARKMELYSSMIDYVDVQVGRLIDVLKQKGKYDNTLFIFMSDNGANPKEPIFYYLGNKELFESQGFDNSLENMGRTNSFVSQGGSWAEVSATPYTYYKTTTGEGGIRTPLIVSGKGVETNGIKNPTMHVTDIFPTILDYIGVERPNTYKENTLNPLYGQSAKSFLTNNSESVRNTMNEPLCFELNGYKAVIKGDWKLIYSDEFSTDTKWQLVNLADDPGEKIDLAEQNPEKFKELKKDWEEYSIKYGYIKPEGKMHVIDIGAEAFYKFE